MQNKKFTGSLDPRPNFEIRVGLGYLRGNSIYLYMMKTSFRCKLFKYIIYPKIFTSNKVLDVQISYENM